jgi:hypothetical protein
VGGGAAAYLKSVTGTSTTDTGLTAGNQYCYTVSAYDAAGNESAQSTQQCATPQAAPAFGGFDFTLSTGNFWEFRWNYYYYSYAQGGSPSTTKDSGRFWVVLGQPIQIHGITAYEVATYGRSKKRESYSTQTFGPRWKYIAMSNKQMLGSTDGLTLTPFVDAQAGKWPGGGFFTAIPGTTLTIGQVGTISTYNTYISGTAIVAGRSSSQSQCEYFSGIGTICGDSSYTYTESEYFRPSIGPVGYYYYNTYDDCGGGFCSSAIWQHSAGLTASSFTGQSNPLVSESEANDSPATADPITKASPIVGIISANTGSTVISVTVVDDTGHTVTASPTIEDWYSFTLVSAATVTITLSFEGSPTADLNLYLTNSAGTMVSGGYSVHNNPTRQDQTERITKSLAAGSYRIGVDGYLTPAGAVTYTLQLE